MYQTGYAFCGFYEDFSKIMNTLSTYTEEVIISGDFNFHLKQADDTFIQNFSNFLTLHNFHSSIDQPTYKLGGWLDVFACKQKFETKYYETGISNPKLLIWKFSLTKPPPIYIKTQRQWKLLDLESFVHEVENSSTAFATNLDFEAAFQL